MAESRRSASIVGTDEDPTLVVDAQPFERAARLLAQSILETLETRPVARLAIPGGSALASVPSLRRRLGEAWRRVRLTWVDERCVPVDATESNRGAAARMGLVTAAGWRCDEPGPDSVLPLYEDGETPPEALHRVDSLLLRDFSGALDVVLLGMGADGHVASLFPPRSADVETPAPAHALVAHVSHSPKPPPDRITLTKEALGTARHVILVATGAEKRDAIESLLAGDPRLPATGLPGLVVVTDLEIEAPCVLRSQADPKGA